MPCIPIKDGILCLADIKFKCPYCRNEYSDDDDKFLNRINRNKQGFTTTTCECGMKFGVSCTYKGLQSFKL